MTTIKWDNVPRSPFRPTFGLEPVSTLSSGLFLAKQCLLLDRGITVEPHTPVSALLEVGGSAGWQEFVSQREFIYTIGPKHALNGPKDFAGFVDHFVTMIAP